MSGAIPPLPQYAFMAWCSVKAQGQLYLYLQGETGYLKVTGKRRDRQSTDTTLFPLPAAGSKCNIVISGLKMVNKYSVVCVPQKTNQVKV
jgi:hypothetical protein